MKMGTMAALATCAATHVHAQTNIGAQPELASLPFEVTKVASFSLPWRLAFLPDGRMLVTEKVGSIQLVTPTGKKTAVANVPAVLAEDQGGMFGVFLPPHYATDHTVYLTYAEPGDGGSSLALAKARLLLTAGGGSLENLTVIWRDGERGQGGQFGAQVAFAPDGQSLFLTVGERQRMTPAQDPNQPLGKILHLTLDGAPAPGNPMAGRRGAPTVPIIDPPADTEKAKSAPVVRTYAFPGPNLTPAEIWTSGHRTPYGLAFAPDGRLWEVEHGPRGGDELNLIEPGRNYGWPLVSYAVNYNGVPIASPDTRPDLAKPVLYWTPVISPGNLAFYRGGMFPRWAGSAFVSGLSTESLNRIVITGPAAKAAERWRMGRRIRDVEVGPDGALWLLEDANPGGLFRLTPKPNTTP